MPPPPHGYVNMASITSLDTGYCRQLACMALQGSGWRTCRFPARAYLLAAHGRHWLWDTGYAPHFHEHTQHGLFSLYARVTPVTHDPAQAARAQLAAMGLAASDLSAIVLSHFHGDHIAGLHDFPGVALYADAGGWDALKNLHGVRALWHGFVPGLLPDDVEDRLGFVQAFESIALPAELAPFAIARALPGAAGEILIVDLPGHAAGHLGAFVQTDDGWVLLASDAAWTPVAYRDMIGPAAPARLILDDRGAYMRTLHKLNQLYRRGRVRILLTHEGGL